MISLYMVLTVINISVYTKSEDIFVKFYEDYLNYKLGIQTILNYLFETFETDNNSECVTKLIQVRNKFFSCLVDV